MQGRGASLFFPVKIFAWIIQVWSPKLRKRTQVLTFRNCLLKGTGLTLCMNICYLPVSFCIFFRPSRHIPGWSLLLGQNFCLATETFPNHWLSDLSTLYGLSYWQLCCIKTHKIQILCNKSQNITFQCSAGIVRKGNSDIIWRHVYYKIYKYYISVIDCAIAYRFNFILVTDELRKLTWRSIKSSVRQTNVSLTCL